MTQGLQFDILSTDYLDHEMKVSINGKRYKYYFHDIRGAEDTVRFIQKSSKGKALGWIKKNSYKWDPDNG